MRKVIAGGYGYSNTRFLLSDFVDTEAKPLVIDNGGCRWRGLIRSAADNQYNLVLSDGRSIPVNESDISFIGDPLLPSA